MRATIILFCTITMTASAASFDLELRFGSDPLNNPASQWKEAQWDPSETAFIVCDMWDSHHSVTAVRRVNEIAPRLNSVLKHVRDQGATIIHSPSDCMPYYSDHPARKNALAVPQAAYLPPDIQAWCHRIPSEEAAIYPIDQSDGGEDETPLENEQWNERLIAEGRNPGTPWLKQNALLEISDSDYIASEGDVVWNILQARGIKHVVLSGVHTNMCVLGRPFGLRRMAEAGMDTVLLRDCTDVMYNPACWPYVSHFTGIDLVIQHIESYVSPTVSSDQFIGGSPFQFNQDTRPRIAIVSPETSDLLDFARQCLGTDFSVSFRGPDNVTHLDDSDLLILSAQDEHNQAVSDYLNTGRPLISLKQDQQTNSTRGIERTMRTDAGRSASTSQGNEYDFRRKEFRLELLNTIRWAVDMDPLDKLPIHPDTRRWSEDWAPADLTQLPASDSLWLRTLLPIGQSAPTHFNWNGATEAEVYLNNEKLTRADSGLWSIPPTQWHSNQLNLLVVHARTKLPASNPKLDTQALSSNWQVISSKDTHTSFPIPPQFGAPTDLIQPTRDLGESEKR